MIELTSLRRVAPAAAALGALAAGALVWAPVGQAETAPGRAPNAIADLVDRVSPSVVTILARHDGQGEGRGESAPFEGSPFEEFFRRFGPPGGPDAPHGRERAGLGSGFVIEADGYVVTNNHVVEGADEVTVRFADEREFEAEVVGTDPQSDLALLKVEATGLPALALGDSEAVRVGEDVIAVGNPFGLGGTVTRGIVSAKARDINAGPYVDFLQTDAAINRGNSGGPLFDLTGAVIGVNTAILSPTGGSVGVGFAVPSNTVRAVVAELKADGAVERGWLGVSIQPVTPEIAAAIGLETPSGALVADVVKGGPAEGVFEIGDVILGFDGREVARSRDLPKLVGATDAGRKAEVRVFRDGAERAVTVEVGRLETREARAAVEDDAAGPAPARLGATLAPLTPEMRERFGLAREVEGAVVTSLKSGGAAARAGLRVGDVILGVGGRDVASPEDVIAALREVEGDALLLRIARDGAPLFLGVPLG
jgi:serine protease Do